VRATAYFQRFFLPRENFAALRHAEAGIAAREILAVVRVGAGFFFANLLTSQKHMISFRSATAPLRNRVIKVKPTTSNTSQQSTRAPSTVDNGKLPSAKRNPSIPFLYALAGSAGVFFLATAQRATRPHPSAAPLAPRRFASGPVPAALPL
jgi:hypothetical protein